jgi:hypothetical protein
LLTVVEAVVAIGLGMRSSGHNHMVAVHEEEEAVVVAMIAVVVRDSCSWLQHVDLDLLARRQGLSLRV